MVVYGEVMKAGIVITNILDMRDTASHSSERVNQLLLGDTVRWSSTRNGFAYVTKWDGYRGWADGRFLVEVENGELSRYEESLTHVVSVQRARVVDSDACDIEPHVLYYGTLLHPVRKREGYLGVALVGGHSLLVKAGTIRPIKKKNGPPVRGSDLVREAKRFLGVPYLWGGITATGFDCSGLVQTIGRRLGLTLPRDTKDQIKVGEPVDRERIKVGDLLFFERHVGIAAADGKILHCSRSGSGVRLESLNPEHPAYREDLDKGFVTARRIV